jgi:hypothetical protein
MRRLARHRHPSLESVGTHAVHAITKHTDTSHAAVLEAIERLLSIGADQRPALAMRPERQAESRVPTA